MIRSAATICLVESIPVGKGPWVFWHDLESACSSAAQAGLDAVELFTESATQIDSGRLERCLSEHGLSLAAVGTGAGKVHHDLDLTDPDPDVRHRGREFIAEMIGFGARFGAATIIGSMQGRVRDGVERERALAWLCESLEELGQVAANAGTAVILEPLNRYESNLLNRLGDAAAVIAGLETDAVRLLADLFHMNIEEASIAGALRDAGRHVGHVHFADSNRRAAGLGHTDFAPIGDALREIEYDGYASAEVFPLPTPEEAAAQTQRAFTEFLRGDR